jgi:hypothetical protein
MILNNNFKKVHSILANRTSGGQKSNVAHSWFHLFVPISLFFMSINQVPVGSANSARMLKTGKVFQASITSDSKARICLDRAPLCIYKKAWRNDEEKHFELFRHTFIYIKNKFCIIATWISPIQSRSPPLARCCLLSKACVWCHWYSDPDFRLLWWFRQFQSLILASRRRWKNRWIFCYCRAEDVRRKIGVAEGTELVSRRSILKRFKEKKF